jgi:hypothetical protein
MPTLILACLPRCAARKERLLALGPMRHPRPDRYPLARIQTVVDDHDGRIRQIDGEEARIGRDRLEPARTASWTFSRSMPNHKAMSWKTLGMDWKDKKSLSAPLIWIGYILNVRSVGGMSCIINPSCSEVWPLYEENDRNDLLYAIMERLHGHALYLAYMITYYSRIYEICRSSFFQNDRYREVIGYTYLSCLLCYNLQVNIAPTNAANCQHGKATWQHSPVHLYSYLPCCLAVHPVPNSSAIATCFSTHNWNALQELV